MSTVAHPASNPWANDANTLALYRRRCIGEAEEMTCARQAAQILAGRAAPGETLLDAGCGGGYYLHSIRRAAAELHYHGLDYTPEMIALARQEMCPRTDLPRERFTIDAIENLSERFDNVLCFNVLTNSPHYAQPLERLLLSARRRVLLRESLHDGSLVVRYTPDPYLDDGKRHIRVYHNTYPMAEVVAFIEEHGYAVTRIRDERTGDGIEQVVDIPHHWKILLAERR
jgi:SAM-dependent methyltransferase